jgi:hypothetical protein
VQCGLFVRACCPRSCKRVHSMSTSSSLTFLPATISVPSGLHASVNGCSPTCTAPTLAFDRTSQNRTNPSVLQLASSFSLIGWNATRSSETAPLTPTARNSVEFLTFGFSGFHIRRVRSAAPVATNVPGAFHDSVRMKCEEETLTLGRRLGLSTYANVLSFENVGKNSDLGRDRARAGGAIVSTIKCWCVEERGVVIGRLAKLELESLLPNSGMPRDTRNYHTSSCM